jgi:hypothetical protein
VLQAARDAARGRLLTLSAGLFAAAALLFTARNFILSRRTVELTRRTFELTEQGQVTDRYTKAIEQLGSEKLDVQVGGIYALERVARDSARDHPAVMEVLTAFIREHSHERWPPEDHPVGREQERSARPDVQAAVTVVGRRDRKRDIRSIDLTRAHLSGARLGGADLRGADLASANLTGADLTGARLGGAHLSGAHLGSADLTGAHLGADLRGADLARALSRADVTRADFTSANLTGANLTGARWPADTPVPEGWKLDTGSGRLTPAGIASGPV